MTGSISASTRGEEMDPGLIKRVSLAILGAVGIIILAVAVMTLL